MSIKKTLTGKHYFAYTCPQCSDALRSPLSEVGTEQTCPRCGAAHVVPGKEEVEAFEQAQQAEKEREAAEQAREAAKQEAQRKMVSRRDVRVAQAQVDKDRLRGEQRPRQPAENPLDFHVGLARFLCVVGLLVLTYYVVVHDVTTSSGSQIVNLARMQDRLIGCLVGLGFTCTGILGLFLATLAAPKPK